VPCTYAGAVLVLTRSVGESVVIGDEVIVKVIEVRGDVVRIGVEAPASVRIYREELYRELVEANRAAASGPQEALSALLAQAAAKRHQPPATG
jgi:carbon storage regulator